MTWRNDGLIQRFDGTFPEPTDDELEAFGYTRGNPVKKRRKRSAINHGTNAGYAAHYRYGGQACEPCRKAHLEAKREIRARARKEAA